MAVNVPFIGDRFNRDELILVFGEAGDVLSIGYAPLVSPLAPKSCDGLDPPLESAEFNSKVSYETSTPGMSLRVVLAGEKPPPGLKYLPYKRSPNQANANGANPLLDDGSNNGQQPPPSGPFAFLSRYWYIVVPMLLFNLLASPAEQPAAPDGRQGRPAGEPAASQSGAAGPSAPSDADLPRQRRGKRG
jgi:hypothetical protein